jgi:hypothetical protein
MKGNTMKMTEDERSKYAMAQSINLRIKFEEALHDLHEIGHETLQKVIEKYFQKDSDCKVTPESICWFFCWAATGMGSFNTAETCRIKFNRIFDKTYGWFDGNIGLDFAHKFRYHKLRRISL